MHKNFQLLALGLILGLSAAQAQLLLSPVEVDIPMRDGQDLAADVYLPDGPGPFSTILIQTPYWKFLFRFGLPLGVDLDIENSPYAFVVLDWRCFYGSIGACTASFDRGEDGYDAVEWIAAQAWSNGKVGTWGPSALGNIQFQTAAKHPPHLTCAMPMVCDPEQSYEGYYPGGIVREEFVETLDVLGFGASTLIFGNPYENAIWDLSSALSYYPDQIEVPTLNMAGWFDHNIDASLKWFNGLATTSPASVRDKHKIFIGPWAHGGFNGNGVGADNAGALPFPAAEDLDVILGRQFFDFYLNADPNGWESRAPITYYQPGEELIFEISDWPPASLMRTYYFEEDNEALTESAVPISSATSSWTYDPRDPSPTVGGFTLSEELLQGPQDQGPEVESRSDNLIYSSSTLGSDHRIQGIPELTLFVETDRKDTDFIIRLCDVHPDGSSYLLAESSQRLRSRNGFRISDTSFAESGEVYELNMEFPNLAYTFKAGHQIRLILTSSNWPRLNRNRNDGGDPFVGADTLIATNTLHIGPSMLSRLELPVASEVLAVEDQVINSAAVRVYPNPASEMLYLELQDERLQGLDFLIFGLDGKTHFSNITAGIRTEIPIVDLPSGFYIIHIPELNWNNKFHIIH
jgi:predicted acyl esterase